MEMTMWKIIRTIVITILWAGWISVVAYAQSDGELVLDISRDFGFSSGTGRIQGTFSMKAKGPDDLQKVIFFIDDQPIGEDDQAPFSIQFRTGNYSLGVHTMSAKGIMSSGRELQSNVFRQEFVAAETGFQTAMKIALPILGVSFAIIILSFVIPILSGRGKQPTLPLGAPRSYGILGGAICPNCARPFGVHIWGMNLIVGKLDRCPHCGKWSIVRRAPLEALKAAEAAEVETSEMEITEATQTDEMLGKELEDSRYLDG
jgi:hypothetical protein